MPLMPNLIGLNYEMALSTLASSQIRVLPLGFFQADPVFVSWIGGSQTDLVVGQAPIAGTTVIANYPVALTIDGFPMGVACDADQGGFQAVNSVPQNAVLQENGYQILLDPPNYWNNQPYVVSQ